MRGLLASSMRSIESAASSTSSAVRLSSSCWTDFGPMIGAARHYEGPMGKSDRAVVLGALALWVGVGGTLPGWLGLLLAAQIGYLSSQTVARLLPRKWLGPMFQPLT